MARIKLVEVEEATGQTREVYSDIQKNFGMVPNLFKAFGLKPEILAANWNKVKAIMLTGELPRDLKEMVAVAVSQANGCGYCVNAHGGMLSVMGIPQEQIVQLIQDFEAADLPENRKAVLRFAVKATQRPHDITAKEVEEIKGLGYNDIQMVELVSVIDLFTAFNRYIDTLQVDIDFPEI